MEKWAYGHHQKSDDDGKEDHRSNDRTSYKSDVSVYTDPDNHAPANDFTERETNTPQPLMSRKEIEEALDQILADVKNKRENDLKILSDVKKEIMAQAAHSCSLLEQYMGHMHHTNSKKLDTQITTLMNALSKSQKLESELEHSKTSLSLLCKDINANVQYM